MKTLRNLFKGRTGAIALAVIEIVVGVLLLIDPLGFTAGIIRGAGVVAVLTGVVDITRYFMVSPEVGAQQQRLFRGMIEVLGGVTAVIKYDWFISAFPLLTVLYAIAMLVLSASRVQKMADMLRMKQPRWYLPGIAAAVAIVLSTIILINPFGAVAAVWTFAAISLLAEAAVDLVTIFLV